MNQKMYINGEYFSKNPTWDVEDSPWKAKQILKIMQKNDVRPICIAEVGCGAGEILRQMQIYHPKIDYTGYDISPQAISLAQSKSNDGLHFKLEDFCQLDVYFDLVLIIDVIEHIEDYYLFIKSIKDKASYKIFLIPLEMNALSVLFIGSILNCRSKVGHIHYFSKDTALETLKDCGYEIIDYSYIFSNRKSPRLSSNLLHYPRKITYNIKSEFCIRLLGGSSLLVLAR
jgi:SAM-dependent methyltransferase